MYKLMSIALGAITLSLSTIAALAAPTEITDALGRKVSVDLPVKRVAVNFNFEEFTAVAGVDGWRKVVGISRAPWEGWRPLIFNRYKAVIPNLAAMPDIGHSEDGSFSAEKVIGLKPDVLLIADWTYKSSQSQVAQIEGAGIPVVVIDYNAQLLERHLASTRALGKVTGQEARAEELATLYQSQYQDILARVAKAKAAGVPAKKVYVELGQAGADTIGNTYNNTMWGKIITTLGAQNIAAGKISALGAVERRSRHRREPGHGDLRLLVLGRQAEGGPHRLRRSGGRDPRQPEALCRAGGLGRAQGGQGRRDQRGRARAVPHPL